MRASVNCSSPVSESGLNSLKLIPENWEQQLKNEKIKLEYELNEEMIQEGRELWLRNRLKQINHQLRRIPYEQLKYHYKKMITKLPV